MNEIINWFLENGFQTEQPFAPINNSEQAVIVCARQGRSDVLAFLLQQGTNLNVVDIYGNNALWAACFAEAAACISLLLAAGINPDYQNPSGATALIYAASSGKTAVVEQLLQAGANPFLTTQDDFSALDLAANRQCLQLIRTALNTQK